MRSQINALKVKEAEDTKALEDMVQLVESNLVTTTVRSKGGVGGLQSIMVWGVRREVREITFLVVAQKGLLLHSL